MSEQKTKDEGYVSIATKVPNHVADLLTILAKQRGMEVYELLQLLVNGFISAAKYTGPLTPDMKQLMDALKLDVAFNQAFNFSSPTATNEIAQLILVLQQPGKKGFGMTMINRPFMGNVTVTRCLDDILERVIEVSMKGLYRQLRDIGLSLQTESMRETLIVMCDAQQLVNLTEADSMEYPGYGTFNDTGRAIEYGNKHKRIHHKSPDSVAQQQTIVFDDYDREVADYEAKDWEWEQRQREEPPEDMEEQMGFRPHGGEW